MKENAKSLLLAARKKKDQTAKNAFESLVNELQNKEIELQRSLTDAEGTATVKKVMKQFTETALYHNQLGNTAEYEESMKAFDLLSELLPAMLTEEQVKNLILSVTAEEGLAIEKKNMGSVVKLVVAKANGQTDGKTVSSIFQTLL